MNRDLILQSAIVLFNERGFKNVKMSDIASNLSISKKTIYKHFHNKSALLNESLDYLFNSFFTKTENQLRKFEFKCNSSLSSFVITRFIDFVDGISLQLLFEITQSRNLKNQFRRSLFFYFKEYQFDKRHELFLIFLFDGILTFKLNEGNFSLIKSEVKHFIERFYFSGIDICNN